MTQPKYKIGKQIHSVAEFEQSDCTFFKVRFGNNLKTIHRGFLISWQYRTLLIWIERGGVYEAESIHGS